MGVILYPGERPEPKAPLFYGDRVIGTVETSKDDDILLIELTELSPLIKELIKAELAGFHLINIPAE